MVKKITGKAFYKLIKLHFSDSPYYLKKLFKGYSDKTIISKLNTNNQYLARVARKLFIHSADYLKNETERTQAFQKTTVHRIRTIFSHYVADTYSLEINAYNDKHAHNSSLTHEHVHHALLADRQQCYDDLAQVGDAQDFSKNKKLVPLIKY